MAAMYLLLCFSAFGIIAIMCFLWAIWCWIIEEKKGDEHDKRRDDSADGR